MNTGAVDKAARETETGSSVLYIHFNAESQMEIILQLQLVIMSHVCLLNRFQYETFSIDKCYTSLARTGRLCLKYEWMTFDRMSQCLLLN